MEGAIIGGWDLIFVTCPIPARSCQWIGNHYPDLTMHPLLQAIIRHLRRRTIRATAAACLLITGLAACKTERVMLEAVGPASPSAHRDDGPGRLIVYTAREQSEQAYVSYFHYSSYSIFTPEGKLYAFVRNHQGVGDEPPQRVALPSGSYVVTGMAQGLGTVSAPVVVQAFKTTELHLESGWKPDPTYEHQADLVRLPNGQIAGWRAPVNAPVPLDDSKATRADAIVRVKLLQAPDTVGTLAYSLVETVSVIRNNTDQPILEKFTVGYHDLQNGVPAGVSTIYLKLAKNHGSNEWRLLEE